MKIEGTGLEEKEITVSDLDHAAEEVGFVRWSWDYSRGHYDYKYEDRKTGETFYLRIPVTAEKGHIEEVGNDSLIKLHQPYIGRHTHPHGLDYEYHFPKHILKDAQERLKALHSKITV